MITKELITMLDNGIQPTIKFTKQVEVHEVDPDEGMLGKLIRYSLDNWGDDCVVQFDVDVSEFVEYNKSVAKRDYFDKDRNPTLTWFESNLYPENHITDVYEMLTEKGVDSECVLFEIVETSKYFQEFLKSGKKNYITYLENKLNEKTKN